MNSLGIVAGQMPYPGGGGGGGSGWNPADVSSSGGTVLAFSDGDRTVTHVGGPNTGATVRSSATSHSSGGPYYFEVECIAAHTVDAGINIGVAELGATLLDNWSAMGAGEIVVNSSAGLIICPGFGTFASGRILNNPGNVLGVLFEPGVGIQINTNGGAFASAAYTAAGNWVPAINLGVNYFGGFSGQDGAFRVAVTAADFGYAVPGGAVEWGN